MIPILLHYVSLLIWPATQATLEIVDKGKTFHRKRPATLVQRYIIRYNGRYKMRLYRNTSRFMHYNYDLWNILAMF